jgi:CheY-like chemotaxis protein
VPVVAITAYTTIGDRKKFTSMGFSDFLPKPFSRADLHKVVRETLLKHS